MAEHPFDQIRKSYGVGASEIIRSWRKSAAPIVDWNRIKHAYDTGNIHLSTLRRVADAIGIPTWLLLYLADTLAGEVSDDDLDLFEAVKRVAKEDKELAFAMYRELLVMGVVDDEMREWADENL